jgi:ADP-heptose:LPS heptosyltransferase/glycosyltransferase involved in cell wall biosynthesis
MRILVSKPDSLGDQLIIAGWLQALTEAAPRVNVVWHVQAGMEVMGTLLEGVTTFYPVRSAAPEAEADRLEREHPTGLVLLPFDLAPFAEWNSSTDERLAWWTTFVGARPWDIAVAAVGNRTWVAEVTVAASLAPMRLGATASPSRQIPVNAAGDFLSRHAPIFHREIPLDVEKPECTSLARLLRATGLPLPEDPQPRLRLLPRTKPRHLILLAPGVGGPMHRAWPVSHFLELAGHLHTAGWQVEWIEGPGDLAFLDPVRSCPEVHIHLLDRSDLQPLAALLQTAEALVCNDTAYAHLAAAIELPAVAVYGGGQGERFHPHAGKVKIVQGAPPCSGCQWHCIHSTFPCVSGVPVSTVLTALHTLLADGDRSPVRITEGLVPVEDGPALLRRLQGEILHLDADRFARLQIIQTLLDTARRAAPAPVSPTSPVSAPAPEEELVSIIIPVGRPERALPTLLSLAAQNPTPNAWEVILVGSNLNALGSVPASLPLRTVVLPARGSPAQTRIAGVAAATGQWYLFVDDDIELAPDFLARTRVIATGLRSAGTGKGPGAIGARLPGRTGGFWERTTDLSNFWSQQSLHPRRCEWLYSATLLVSASAYREAGGFDPSFPVGEDVDLTQRLLAQGYTLHYEPSLVAYHHHRRDTPWTMWRYFWQNGNGARFFFRAHGGACVFSAKTVWLKTWADVRMNRTFQTSQGMALGLRTPLVWFNYLIVEASLEWHWQRHLREAKNYLRLPARLKSDLTYVRSMKRWDEGRNLRAMLLYLQALLQDLANPIRR